MNQFYKCLMNHTDDDHWIRCKKDDDTPAPVPTPAPKQGEDDVESTEGGDDENEEGADDENENELHPGKGGKGGANEETDNDSGDDNSEEEGGEPAPKGDEKGGGKA